MITDEKIKEIKKLLRKGVPQGEIIEVLKGEGYSQEDISKIFTGHTYDMRSWYLVFAVVFLLIGLYLVIIKQGFLMIIFSALMFYMYYREVERLKSKSSK